MTTWESLSFAERTQAIELLRVAKHNYEALHPVQRSEQGLAYARRVDELMMAALLRLTDDVG